MTVGVPAAMIKWRTLESKPDPTRLQFLPHSFRLLPIESNATIESERERSYEPLEHDLRYFRTLWDWICNMKLEHVQISQKKKQKKTDQD